MRRLLVIGITLGVVSALHCDASDPEAQPTEPYVVVEEERLPPWAIGAFTRHDIDVTVYRVAEDGTVAYALLGGDYGGWSCGHAEVVAGEVRITVGGRSERLVLDANGYAFVANGDPPSYRAFAAADLCGRDVGGCGGYGHVEPCTPGEIAAREAVLEECRKERVGDAGVGADAGVDAGVGVDGGANAGADANAGVDADADADAQ